MICRLLPLTLLATAMPAIAGPGAERIDIDLSNFKFTPSTISLRSGGRYVLHFVNRSRGGHDFHAKTFFAAATMAPLDRLLVKNGEIELAGGQSRDITIIAPAAGSYRVHCTHFLHATFGMEATLKVRS